MIISNIITMIIIEIKVTDDNIILPSSVVLEDTISWYTRISKLLKMV